MRIWILALLPLFIASCGTEQKPTLETEIESLLHGQDSITSCDAQPYCIRGIVGTLKRQANKWFYEDDTGAARVPSFYHARFVARPWESAYSQLTQDVEPELAYFEHIFNGVVMWHWPTVLRLNGDFFNGPPIYMPGNCGVDLYGRPKRDLNAFNPAYFDAIKAEAVAANKRGMMYLPDILPGFAIEQSTTGLQQVWDSQFNCTTHIPNSGWLDGTNPSVVARWTAYIDALKTALDGLVHGYYLNVATPWHANRHVLVAALHAHIRATYNQNYKPLVIQRGYISQASGNTQIPAFTTPDPSDVFAYTTWANNSPFAPMSQGHRPDAPDLATVSKMQDADAGLYPFSPADQSYNVPMTGYASVLIDSLANPKPDSRHDATQFWVTLSTWQRTQNPLFELSHAIVQRETDTNPAAANYFSDNLIAVHDPLHNRTLAFQPDPQFQQGNTPGCTELKVAAGNYAVALLKTHPRLSLHDSWNVTVTAGVHQVCAPTVPAGEDQWIWAVFDTSQL